MAAARLRSALAAALAVTSGTAFAQDAPTIDTEDATLGSTDIGSRGRVHPQLAVDLRNGDFARGAYDDDRANLARLPVHVQLGVAIELKRGAGDKPDAWLVLRSSNGFHAPGAGETTAPRAWYESNNLAALVLSPAPGLRTAAVYTIKTSPDGVSATTHEASLSIAYAGHDAIGMLSPSFAATFRPKGDHGLFTQLGIEPGIDLSHRQDAARLSLPITAGIGWRGFYGAGSRNRSYASAGAAIEQPFTIATTRWRARAEALAVIRDDRLAALSGPDGETATLVPLVTLSASMAY